MRWASSRVSGRRRRSSGSASSDAALLGVTLLGAGGLRAAHAQPRASRLHRGGFRLLPLLRRQRAGLRQLPVRRHAARGGASSPSSSRRAACGRGSARTTRRRAARLFLLLWEWFRIYFESGVVKLLSGDPQWRTLTAMDHYYENGPLPTWIGWYVQQCLPHALPRLHRAAYALRRAGGRLARLRCRGRSGIACFCIVTPLQVGIILTANYAFLNYLVLCLGVLLLDDAILGARSGCRRRQPTPWPARVALARRGLDARSLAGSSRRPRRFAHAAARCRAGPPASTRSASPTATASSR